MVTSRPRPRQVAATSAPMKPAPMTTTFGPCSSRARSAIASSSDRSVKTPSRSGCIGRRRGTEPVAMIEAVERDRLAVVERDRAGGEVERGRPPPEAPVEVEVVDALLAQHDVVGFGLPREQILRQRRPVVREVRLRADRNDAAVEALAAQRLGGAQTRERHADDCDGLQGKRPPRAVRRTIVGAVSQVAGYLTPTSY